MREKPNILFIVEDERSFANHGGVPYMGTPASGVPGTCKIFYDWSLEKVNLIP